MAKKKKKVAKKKPVKGRATKKPASTATSKKPSSKKAISPRAGTKTTSVDTLLKEFEKERNAQEAKLAGALKKIDEFQLKATKLEEQIAKLKTEAKNTQVDIDQIDSRRDAEVAEVLAKLGVQLSANSNSPAPRPVLTLGMSSAADEDRDDSDSDQDD